MKEFPFSRREFLKAGSLFLGGVLIQPRIQINHLRIPGRLQFPQAERLGRVVGGKVEVKASPDDSSPTIKELFEDTVVIWLREVVGHRPLWYTQRYVETPDGYIYSPNLQPVKNQPNQPIQQLLHLDGFWAEVTVPYVDIILANPPGRSPWLEYTQTPRLYYSQIMWIDQIRKDEANQVWYRVSDRYGSFGDFFWAPAESLRPLTIEEMSPIDPLAGDKMVVVNLADQGISCFEGSQEVYYCRVSTGPKLQAKNKSKYEWATPPGKHTIWRKLISVHMTGGAFGDGYDLCGIGWTTLFASKGMAIHSTFWHNSYGVATSHGCVNCSPDDAKWIFRWTLPVVPMDTGEVTASGQESTKVLVKEG